MTRKELLNTNGVNNIINFGKYKGKTILQVIDENPAYIVWCIKNVKGFIIDNNLGKELCKQYDEHFRKYKLAQANGYTENDVQMHMHKYNINVIESLNFLEYDVPEHF